ncbi:MAG TPA: hypothetical protein VK601_27295, partial [Kofleriaceae bacterium]|nr:hypothetical protein [Kofleriaceae bacterium]
MPFNRLFLVAAACAAPLSIAACGGSDSEAPIIPEGTHHGYVVNSVSIPTTSPQVTQFGLDLGTKLSAKLDGTPENALGQLLATLASPAIKFDLQGPLTDAVKQGSLLLLVDFQTKDFTSAAASGLSVKFGATPMPAPCNAPGDCGHHLDGTGTFTIAPGSPTDDAIAGKIVSGSFNGGPGDLTLQIAIGSTTPISLALLHARVQATGISETGIMSANVGGLVTQTELNTKLGPAIQGQIATIIDRDCKGARTPPGCGCTADSTGAQIISLIEGLPPGKADCQITVEEIFGNLLVMPMLAPD